MRLKSLSLVAALFVSTLCAAEPPHVYLHAPDLSRENVIGTIAGVRPYRKSGIRLETEQLKDKVVIHNYGYGGSGFTFCWGGSAKVVSLLEKEVSKNPQLTSKRIAILGSGVIGLTTAYDLMEKGSTPLLWEWAYGARPSSPTRLPRSSGAISLGFLPHRASAT